MDKLEIARIIVFAPDLDEAQRFYGEVLGFEIAEQQDTFMRLHAGHLVLDVFRCDQSSDHAGYSQKAGVAVAFSVPSVSGAMRELRSKGVTVLHEEPNDGPDGTRYAAFVDPFGTVFELIENGGEDTASQSCAKRLS